MTIWWLKFQEQLNITFGEALILAVGHFVVGVITMKIWAILEVGGDIQNAANMRLYGALFLMTPLYYLWAKLTKRNIPLAMDVVSVCIIGGLVAGRINCLISGCCEGLPLFYGSEMRWPLREIELIYCAIFVVIAVPKVLKKCSYGLGVPTFMVSYGMLRFVMEWVREEYTGSLGNFHLAHIWSLISIVVGAGIYIYLSKSHKKINNRANTR